MREVTSEDHLPRLLTDPEQAILLDEEGSAIVAFSVSRKIYPKICGARGHHRAREPHGPGQRERVAREGEGTRQGRGIRAHHCEDREVQRPGPRLLDTAWIHPYRDDN